MSVIVGTSDRDVINAGASNDEIYAGAEYDVVAGGDGSDYIEGNGGDDYLLGGNGSDIYGYYLGDGDDIVSDYSGNGGGETDVIRLVDLSINDVHFYGSNGDLFIVVEQTGHQIRIVGGDPTSPTFVPHIGIELVQFSDFSTISMADVVALMQPASQYVYGDSSDNTIIGNGMAISYYLGAGNDTLQAGAGSDYIFAGAGWDSVDLGADTQRDFVFFEQGNERDYLGNFDFTRDVVQFQGFGSRADFIANTSVYQDGTSTVIEHSNGQDLLVFAQTNVADVLYHLNNATDTFWF